MERRLPPVSQTLRRSVACRTVPAPVTLVWALMVSATLGAPLSADVDLVLPDTLLGYTVRLYLSCRDDTWNTQVTGHEGRSYSSTAFIHGKITEITMADGKLRLAIKTLVPNESTQWTVATTVDGDSLDGAFHGSLMSIALAGTATGKIRRLPRGFHSVGVGEHPRLFFRASDVARIRALAGTPQGRAIMDVTAGTLPSFNTDYYSGGVAAGRALQYLLSGNKRDLLSARAWLVRALKDKSGEHAGWPNMHRVTYGAIAYDLLYPHLTPQERGRYRFILRQWALYYRATDPTWPFTGGFGAAGGMAALAILNDPVTLPPPPVSPSDARFVPAAKGYTPPSGVPVLQFTDDRMPTTWLYAGAFAPDEGDDPLEDLGGRAAARPSPGASVTYKGITDRFEEIVHTENLYSAKQHNLPGFAPVDPGFNMYKLPKFKTHPQLGRIPSNTDTEYEGQLSCFYCYTVVRVDREMAVKAKPNSDGITLGLNMWLNGSLVEDDEILRLEPGLYPLLVELPIVGLWWAPRLAEYTRADHQKDLDAWRADSILVALNGGVEPYATAGIGKAAEQVKSYLDASTGSRGFAIERMGAGEVMNFVLPYLAAHGNVTGIDLVKEIEGGVEWMIPLAMMTSNREPNLQTADAGYHNYWKTMAFEGLVPPQWRPALRWHMENDGKWGIKVPGHGLFALLTYPWDLETTQHPGDLGLPLFWNDDKANNYVFRNGWTDPEDLFTVVTQTNHFPTHIRAMEFVVQGLGQTLPFTGLRSGPEGFFAAPKIQETNTVRIPGAIPLEGGRPLYLSRAADGSGIVSAEVKHYGKGRLWQTPSQVWGGIGGGVYVDDTTNLGVSVFRSIGIDYSRASGLPGLIAVVDRIEGPTSEEPFVQLHFGAKGRGARESNRFTLDMGGRTVCVTFLEPVNVRLAENGRSLEARGGREFFYTVTMGGAPPVVTTGEGLRTVATIGSQMVSFSKGAVRFASYTGSEIPIAAPTDARAPARGQRSMTHAGCVEVHDLRGRLVYRWTDPGRGGGHIPAWQVGARRGKAALMYVRTVHHEDGRRVRRIVALRPSPRGD